MANLSGGNFSVSGGEQYANTGSGYQFNNSAFNGETINIGIQNCELWFEVQCIWSPHSHHLDFGPILTLWKPRKRLERDKRLSSCKRSIACPITRLEKTETRHQPMELASGSYLTSYFKSGGSPRVRACSWYQQIPGVASLYWPNT